MTDELGFDLPADLRSPGPSSSPLPSLSPTTRGVTTRGISTTGAEFLRSLPLSVDETLARARASGRPLRFGQRELYVWKIRLAVERGLVRPHRVLTVALTGADFPTVKVWAGFVLLVGCKWL
jgi:hypothetical protein